MPGRFEFVDHTADLMIRAEGTTLGEAFAAAALGMFTHMTDPSRVREVGEVVLLVEAPTPEELLVRWLEELRFANESRLVVFHRFEANVTRGDSWRLEGRGFGEDYDEARHEHIHEVKAVTLHHLRVRTQPPQVEVVVDI